MVVSKQNKSPKTAQKTPYFGYCLFYLEIKVILCDIRPKNKKYMVLPDQKIPALYPTISDRKKYWYAIPKKILCRGNHAGEDRGKNQGKPCRGKIRSKNRDRETKNRTCQGISIYIDMVISRDVDMSMDIEGKRSLPVLSGKSKKYRKPEGKPKLSRVERWAVFRFEKI